MHHLRKTTVEATAKLSEELPNDNNAVSVQVEWQFDLWDIRGQNCTINRTNRSKRQ